MPYEVSRMGKYIRDKKQISWRGEWEVATEGS